MSSFSVSPSIRATSLNSNSIDHHHLHKQNQHHVILRAPPLTLFPQHQRQADQMLLVHDNEKNSRTRHHSANSGGSRNNSHVRASSTVSNISNLGVTNIPNGLESFIFQHQEFAEKLLLPFEEDGIIEVKRKTVPLQLLRKIQLQVLAKKTFSGTSSTSSSTRMNNNDVNNTAHDEEKVQDDNHCSSSSLSSSSPILRWFRDNENKFFHQQHLQNELLAKKEAKRVKKLRQRKALGFSPSSSSSSSSGDDDDDQGSNHNNGSELNPSVENKIKKPRNKNKKNDNNDTDSRKTCGNTNSASRRSEAFENEMNFDFALPTIIVGVTCLICNHQHSMESDFDAIYNVYLAEHQQQQNDLRRDEESPDSVAKSLLGISNRNNNSSHDERQSSIASTASSKISSASTARSSIASSFAENHHHSNSLLRFANQRHSSRHRSENGERSQEHDRQEGDHQEPERNSLLNSRTAVRTRESLASLFSSSSAASTSSANNNNSNINNFQHQQRRSQPDDESKLLLEHQEQQQLFMLQQHRQQQLAEVGCVLWAFKEHHQLLFPTSESANSGSMSKFYSEESPAFLAAFWTNLVSTVRYHCASARHRAALVALHGTAETNAISRNYLTPTIPSLVSTKGTFLSNGAMTRMTSALHGSNRPTSLPSLAKVVPKQPQTQNDNGGNNSNNANDNNSSIINNMRNNLSLPSIKQRLARRKQLQKMLDEMRKQRTEGMNKLKELKDSKKNNHLSLLQDENDQSHDDSDKSHQDFSDFDAELNHQQEIQQFIIHNNQPQLQLLIEQQTDIIDDVATNLDSKFVAAFLSENAYFHDDGRLLSSLDRGQVQHKHVNNNNYALPPPRFVPREVIWINGYPALASRALGGDECFERGRRRFRNDEHYFDGNPNNGYLFLESYRDYKNKTRMLTLSEEAREHRGNKKRNNNNEKNNKNHYDIDHDDDEGDDDCLSNASNQNNIVWERDHERSKSVASMSMTGRPSTTQQEVIFFHKEQDAREKFQTPLQWYFPTNAATSNASSPRLPQNCSRVVVNDSTRLITNKLSREYLLQFFHADKKEKPETDDDDDDALSSREPTMDEDESVNKKDVSTKKINTVDVHDSLLREDCVFVSASGKKNSENAVLPKVLVNPGKYYRVSNVQSHEHSRSRKIRNSADIREEAKIQPKNAKVRFNGKNHLEAWVIFHSCNNQTDLKNKGEAENNSLDNLESGKRRQREEENGQQELTQKLLQKLHHHHHHHHHHHSHHHHENDNTIAVLTRHQRNTHERQTANKQKKDTIEEFVLSQQKK